MPKPSGIESRLEPQLVHIWCPFPSSSPKRFRHGSPIPRRTAGYQKTMQCSAEAVALSLLNRDAHSGIAARTGHSLSLAANAA
jgi:hypothetical protein